MGWQMSAHTSGGGALYDLGSHAVDLVRFLVGEPTGVTSVQRTYTAQRRIPGARRRHGRCRCGRRGLPPP